MWSRVVLLTRRSVNRCYREGRYISASDGFYFGQKFVPFVFKLLKVLVKQIKGNYQCKIINVKSHAQCNEPGLGCGFSDLGVDSTTVMPCRRRLRKKFSTRWWSCIGGHLREWDSSRNLLDCTLKPGYSIISLSLYVTKVVIRSKVSTASNTLG